MSEINVGQVSMTYSYRQLSALRRWIERDESLPHAMHGFMCAESIEPSYWLFWFEFAEKIKAETGYPERAFLGSGQHYVTPVKL